MLLFFLTKKQPRVKGKNKLETTELHVNPVISTGAERSGAKWRNLRPTKVHGHPIAVDFSTSSERRSYMLEMTELHARNDGATCSKRKHSTRHFDRSEAKWSEVEKSTTNESPWTLGCRRFLDKLEMTELHARNDGVTCSKRRSTCQSRHFDRSGTK